MVVSPEFTIERDETPIAILSDPQFEDMFWNSWHVEPLVADPAERAAMLTPEYWSTQDCRSIRYVCRRSGQVATLALWAGQPIRNGRLVMRGLYVPQRVRFAQSPWRWLELVSGW
jgi:hypothetical protein